MASLRIISIITELSFTWILVNLYSLEKGSVHHVISAYVGNPRAQKIHVGYFNQSTQWFLIIVHSNNPPECITRWQLVSTTIVPV